MNRALDTTLGASPRIGILALVAEPWSMRWSTRHQILTRLSSHFPVVWVTPAHEWRDSQSRLGRKSFTRPLDAYPDFVVYEPEAVLPVLYRPKVAAALLERIRLRRARKMLQSMGCTHIILSIWHPRFSDGIDLVSHAISLFHIDDDYSFSDEERELDPSERRLLEGADQVFVHSHTLLERNRPHAQRIALSPNGVDCDLYSAPTAEPADLANIPHPRIGYTGYIKQQIDWDMMLTLAQRHPEWSFVFVGRRSPHPEISTILEKLDALSNVYFLGEKTTSDLARYPQHFDVCMMPYRINRYTKYINPLKLNEYRATGRPSVGAAIPSLVSAAGVAIATSADEWSAAIATALDPARNTPEIIAERQSLAMAFDWNTIVATMVTTIHECLSATPTWPL